MSKKIMIELSDEAYSLLKTVAADDRRSTRQEAADILTGGIALRANALAAKRRKLEEAALEIATLPIDDSASSPLIHMEASNSNAAEDPILEEIE